MNHVPFYLAAIAFLVYITLVFFNTIVSRSNRCDKIVPLVDALVSTNLVNVFSFGQGYFYFNMFLVPKVVPPFVCFRTSIDVAKEVHKSMIDAYKSNDKFISTVWRVECYFDSQNELTFIFRSLELNEKSRNVFWSIWRYIVRRKKLDAEFVELGSVINKALSSRPDTCG